MKTFYDQLQVSPLASREVIIAAHERLVAGLDESTPEGLRQRKALNDALFTLSDPERRERYDRILLGMALPDQASATHKRSKAVPILLWLGACAVALSYVQYSRSSQQKMVEQQQQRVRDMIAAEERMQDPRSAEEKAADREAARLRREEEQLAREERQRELALQRAEQEQQRAFEQARREADNNMRSRQRTEEKDAREEERALRNAERQQQQDQEREYREAQRRLEKEKALARKLEAENDPYRRPVPY
ncbi:MAG: hypothetical protein H6943_05790 [Zoogloeaceae bacterium]|nr:hypothetical protein [Zoogloeaceae bacterium]